MRSVRLGYNMVDVIIDRVVVRSREIGIETPCGSHMIPFLWGHTW